MGEFVKHLRRENKNYIDFFAVKQLFDDLVDINYEKNLTQALLTLSMPVVKRNVEPVKVSHAAKIWILRFTILRAMDIRNTRQKLSTVCCFAFLGVRYVDKSFNIYPSLNDNI